ncbi:Uncharacterised protein [Bordetella pertussis]|nr:Uncharacterised protein [Bordetella pertussis]
MLPSNSGAWISAASRLAALALDVASARRVASAWARTRPRGEASSPSTAWNSVS